MKAIPIEGPRRLAVLTAWYPSSRAPLEASFVHDHVRAWKDEIPQATGDSCDVAVMTVAYSLDLPNRWLRGARLQRNDEEVESVPVIHEQALRLTNRICIGEARAEGLRVELGYTRLAQRLGGEPDLVVAQTLSAALWATELRRRRGSPWPIVLVEHSNPVDMHLRSWCRRRRWRAAREQVDAIVVVADRQVWDFVRLAPGRQVVRIWNPVHSDFLSAPVARRPLDSRPRLVTVARLAKEKGVDRLLLAMPRLPSSLIGELEIIGGGECEGRLRELARSLGIEQRVVFRGPCQRSAVIERLSAGGIFVLASRWENCPVALLEAQCLGMPCVVAENGANERVLLEGNGLSVRAGEPDLPAAIAAGVLAVARSLETYQAEEIRRRAALAFSPAAFAKQTLAVFREASLARHGVLHA